MVRRLACAIALACAAAVFAGCATIVHGTTERVEIDSTPTGAEVMIDDSAQSAITPAQIKLARGSAHKLVFHKAGYVDATENLTSSTSGWILGNLVAGGVVGMVIDESDGAGRKLSADSVNVTLTPLPPSQLSKAAAALAEQAETAAPAPPHPMAKVHETAAAPEQAQPADDEPAPPVGPPPDSFTDDESGYSRRVVQTPGSP